ncbi:cytochrome P450 CYP682H1 [Lasiosphaeria hispida]|uniref:Cytochrome P450 CYP682H1 n=1 Tax=Lasiosphaeria hispida TaxID=260671 RepID=A0AAJ0MB12_9PEZI|nr:cytochrome P450 CYP682H1 [Lasiosphaeria hispida]
MTTADIAIQLSVLAILALISRSIYRLYLSPLSKFPGPWLAAITSAYEAYYDCFKDGGGRYHVEIARMHDRYGPIVRINPWELHIRDPDWNDVYKVARRASKSLWYYQFLGTSSNSFSASSADTHRLRRDAIQPYFSPAAVARHQPEIERLVAKLVGRLRALKGSGKVVCLSDVFRALATDVATAFAFRQPFGHLDAPDFERAGNATVRRFGTLGLLNRHLGGWLLPAIRLVPPRIAMRLSPASLGVAGFFKQFAVVVNKGLNSADEFVEMGAAETDIIRQILNSNLPAEEKSHWHIKQESSSVALAGTETTGSILTVILFYLLSEPGKGARLREEIGKAYNKYGRPPVWQELKELSYMTGVVNEGLRMNAPSGRLPRYDPMQDMTYKSWVIPKGTHVSTTQNDISFSPDIFFAPHDFLPERWIDGVENKRVAKYFNPFGRGTRICIGMEIALIEIYLALGRIFAPDVGFTMNLHGCDKKNDVEMFHDYFSPFPRSDKGVNVLVW